MTLWLAPLVGTAVTEGVLAAPHGWLACENLQGPPQGADTPQLERGERRVLCLGSLRLQVLRVRNPDSCHRDQPLPHVPQTARRTGHLPLSVRGVWTDCGRRLSKSAVTSLGVAVPLEGGTGPVVWREPVDGQEEAGLAKRVLQEGGACVVAPCALDREAALGSELLALWLCFTRGPSFREAGPGTVHTCCPEALRGLPCTRSWGSGRALWRQLGLRLHVGPLDSNPLNGEALSVASLQPSQGQVSCLLL